MEKTGSDRDDQEYLEAAMMAGHIPVKAAFAIVLGIVLVFEVPDRFFKIRK